MASEAPDVGIRFLDDLFARLLVDEAWSVREARGFVWWPHRFAQRVAVSEPFEDAGVVGCRVTVETDVLLLAGDGAPVAPQRLAGVLAELMRFPPMAGFVVDEAAGLVRLFTGLFVHESLAPFLAPRLAVASILQATYAELGCDELARATGLPPARSAHPSSGARPAPDGLLRLAGERVVPAGDEPSRYQEAGELHRAAEQLVARGARAAATPSGLDARFPFRAGGDDPFAPRHSSLLQVRHAEPHPELGRGVFVRLFLPVSASVAERTPDDAALHLNALERRDERFTCASLGSWCLERSESESPELAGLETPKRLAYVLFLPNYVRIENLLFNTVLDAGMRALWAAHVLAHAPAA